MNIERLRTILAEEFERAENLPHGAAEHIAAIRSGQNIGEGIKAALRAMERVASEVRGTP